MDSSQTPGLPEPLLKLIALTVPTYKSAEILVFIATKPERRWKSEEIVAEIQPILITLPAVKQSMALFQARGIVKERDGHFHYEPASSELREAIEALVAAYNQRPVTLIQTIYRIAESRVQSFADSFNLREE
jgi:hypothetical protein